MNTDPTGAQGTSPGQADDLSIIYQAAPDFWIACARLTMRAAPVKRPTSGFRLARMPRPPPRAAGSSWDGPCPARR
jgi:hypothetical protein